MNFLIDAILIIIAVLIIISGYKNGLVKSVLSLATTVVAIVVACAATPYLSDAVCEGFLLDRVSSGIETTVSSVAKSDGEYDFSKVFDNMPDIMCQVLDRYDVNEDSLENFVSDMTETGENAVKSVARYIATPVTVQIANALSFIFIFFVSFILLKIAEKIIELFFKAPVLKTADKAAGIIFGIINASIVLWALSIIISVGVASLGSVSPDWFGEHVIDNSFVLKLFSQYNPIKILQKIVTFSGSR